MTAFFKRNEKTTIAELEEYYANQPKKRTGMAWFMAFVSLVITIAIIVGVFFVGRWIYRMIKDDDVNEVTTSDVSSENIDLPNFDSNELGDKGLAFEDSTSNSQSDIVEGDLSTEVISSSAAGEVTDEAASTSRPNADRIATNNQSSNTNGATSSSSVPSSSPSDPLEIPNTGAGEMIFLIPAMAGVLGYAVSRRRQINK